MIFFSGIFIMGNAPDICLISIFLIRISNGNEIMVEYTVKTGKIRVAEYQLLRHTTDWFQLEDNVVEKSLDNDLFALTVYEEERPVGMGRVVGDGAIYFYIQDIIVIPEYQGKGIGRLIMDNIEDWLSGASYENSFVGLMAAEGVSGFYERYGYLERPSSKPGMSKLMKG